MDGFRCINLFFVLSPLFLKSPPIKISPPPPINKQSPVKYMGRYVLTWIRNFLTALRLITSRSTVISVQYIELFSIFSKIFKWLSPGDVLILVKLSIQLNQLSLHSTISGENCDIQNRPTFFLLIKISILNNL